MSALIAENAKAIVAVLMLAVAIIANHLGVDTGIDIEHWWIVLLTALGVWSVPNRKPG